MSGFVNVENPEHLQKLSRYACRLQETPGTISRSGHGTLSLVIKPRPSQHVQPRKKKGTVHDHFYLEGGHGAGEGLHQHEFRHNLTRGWTAVPKNVSQGSSACVKRARESSLAVKGAALFNLCPQGLRAMASDHRDRFKENLDAWLYEIQDQPTIPGCSRAAISNSLLHQVQCRRCDPVGDNVT